MFKRLKNFRISSLLDVLWPDDDFWRTPAPKPPSPGLVAPEREPEPIPASAPKLAFLLDILWPQQGFWWPTDLDHDDTVTQRMGER